MIEFEKSVYSQNGEDGIIKHIFDKIGTTNKLAVEFGVSVGGGGGQTNTRALIDDGWKVFWFDCVDSSIIPNNCDFTKVKLTSKNIVNVFQDKMIPKNFDFLSIDVDGNDYYLREALSVYVPRVYVIEYNGSFDGSTEYVMPENDEYVWKNKDQSFGASIKSLTLQAEKLGYDLVYCERRGVNAFFIKKEINPFLKKTSEDAYRRLYWAK